MNNCPRWLTISVTDTEFEEAKQPVAVLVTVTAYTPKSVNKAFAGVIDEAVVAIGVPFNVQA